MMPQLVANHESVQKNQGIFVSRLRKKASLILYASSLAIVIGWEALQMFSPSGSLGKPVSLELRRGNYTYKEFMPEKGEPRAIILFASGDGGWSSFEETICRTLQQNNYEVIGIDCRAYAETDYDLATLQSDYAAIAAKAAAPYEGHAPPLIMGGWSMGAGQVIAAAGGPHPAPNITGLLLLDPSKRGRYGLRIADETNILPQGPGTFGMQDFSQTMGHVRVAQWHAVLDDIDSRAWLATLTAPHKEFDFAPTGHYYKTDRADFLHQLVDSISWILHPEATPAAVPATGGES